MVGTLCAKEGNEGIPGLVSKGWRSTGQATGWWRGLGEQFKKSRSEDSWNAKTTEDRFEVDIALTSWILAESLDDVNSVQDSLGRLRALSWSLRAPRSFVSMWSFTWETVQDVSTRVVSHWSVVTEEREDEEGFISIMGVVVYISSDVPNRHPRVISRNS